MKREWFSTTELIGLGGLPSTIQGVNKRAKREVWQSRKRQGVQGKAVEYHIDSLPDATKMMLLMKDNQAGYMQNTQDPLAVWVTAFHQMTQLERERLIGLIIRHGIGGLLSQLDEVDE